MSYLCITKKDCDGLCHQRTKLRRGIEPRLSLPRKRRSGLSPSSFKQIPLDTVQLTPPKTALMMTKYLIVAATVLFSLPALAQQGRNMTLKQCIEIGLTNNYGIKAAEKSVERAKVMQGSAWDLDKTELSLAQDPTSGGSPDNALSLTQQMDFPTVYVAKEKLLKAETQLERGKVEVTRQQLSTDIASLYYQLVYKQELIDILQEQDSVIGRLCSIAAKRHEAGEARKLERLTMERKQMDNRQELLQAKNDFATLQKQMMALMNIAETVLPAESKLEALNLDFSGFNFSNTVEGQLAQDKIEVADKAVTLAKNGYAPSLSVSLRNQLVISSWNPYSQDRSKFTGGNFMGFEVGIGVPLFFGATKAKVKAAKRDREIADLEMRQGEAQRHQEYDVLLNKLSVARQKMDYYNGDGSRLVNEMVRLAETEYENGEITYLDFANVLEESVSHSMKRASAINDYNQVVISLLQANGEIGKL